MTKRLLVVAVALATGIAACSGSTGPQPAPAAREVTAPAASGVAPPAVDLGAVGRSMVAAALVKAGDKVLIVGSVRDSELLEELAVETMKVGGQPLISITSEKLGRRSYDEVPASYDSEPRTLGMALVNAFDVQLSIDVGETENAFAGVPAGRIAARAKAGMPVNEAILKRGLRMVNLGNALYPTAALAGRLGKTQADVAAIFWKAAAVSPDAVRSRGEALRTALSAGKQLVLSSANGTNIRFAVLAAKSIVSDGALTPEKVALGGAAAQTWLPAGELLVPVAPGTAEGTVVVDKALFQGTMIERLTLVFSKGKLTSMTAASGLDALKALYDASGGGKDEFSYIDLGLNPEARLPTDRGPIVWMAPGGVTIGLGDNTVLGGTIISDFGFSGAVAAATLGADGKVLIDRGTLK